MRTGLRIALLAALVLLAPAAARAQANPATFSLELAADGPGEADPGTVHAVRLTLHLEGSGFACAADASVPVNLTVDDADAVEGAILEAPTNATLPLARGAHAAPATPYAVEARVDARLLLARYAAQGATSVFTVRATALPAEAEGCTTQGAEPVTAEARYTVRTANFDPGDPRFHPEHEAHGGAAFDAYLKPGESFSHTFETPGRYPYHDHLEPERKGLVRVLRYAEGDANGTGEATVRITAEGYRPDNLAVKAGTTVTWVNADNVTRSVSADEQHDQSTGLEPEDREALRASDADDGRDGDAGDAPAETPGPGALAATIAAAFAAAARTLKRRE